MSHSRSFNDCSSQRSKLQTHAQPLHQCRFHLPVLQTFHFSKPSPQQPPHSRNSKQIWWARVKIKKNLRRRKEKLLERPTKWGQEKIRAHSGSLITGCCYNKVKVFVQKQQLAKTHNRMFSFRAFTLKRLSHQISYRRQWLFMKGKEQSGQMLRNQVSGLSNVGMHAIWCA